MGRGHISYEGTRLLAVCDVDRKHLADALAAAGKDVKGYADYREVLQRARTSTSCTSPRRRTGTR